MEEITLEQALRADAYVNDYIELMGGDPATVKSTPGFEEILPSDVREAVETYRSYWAKMEKKGMLP